MGKALEYESMPISQARSRMGTTFTTLTFSFVHSFPKASQCCMCFCLYFQLRKWKIREVESFFPKSHS